MPFRTKDTPINPKPGRSHKGKMMISGAVEIYDKAPDRLRLKVINDYSAKTLGTFVHTNLVPGSRFTFKKRQVGNFSPSKYTPPAPSDREQYLTRFKNQNWSRQPNINQILARLFAWSM